MCACNDLSEDIQRAQAVRMLDVLIIGPALILFGILPKIPFFARVLLVLIGAGTIIYNGYFYFKYKK